MTPPWAVQNLVLREPSFKPCFFRPGTSASLCVSATSTLKKTSHSIQTQRLPRRREPQSKKTILIRLVDTKERRTWAKPRQHRILTGPPNPHVSRKQFLHDPGRVDSGEFLIEALEGETQSGVIDAE